jgi:cardiolipin synthase
MIFLAPFSESLQILLLGPYIVLSAIVTVDVLLRKRDVRSALGWIGVTWLSPFFGAALYYLFGINRVTRRASQFDRPQPSRGAHAVAASPPSAPNIAALARASGRVTGSPLEAGNRITILHGGDEAYPAMLAAIAGARHSVALASYIFRNDAVGRSFIAALAAAQERGVAVRVLLDGVGTGYFHVATVRAFKAARVPMARFLHTWVPWRMPFLNMRSHKKLLIIDGACGFCGGLNIGAENTTQTPRKDYVEDLHLCVEGPVVRQFMDTFARDWAFATDETLDQDIWWPAIVPKGPVLARGIHSGPDADIDKLEAILGAALAQAATRVRIVTPYFLPDQRLQFAIAQARLRGVHIDILIPEWSDYFFIDWAVRAHLRFFGNANADIHLGPLPFDHSKLMTVDGEWCLVGSSNWDARSLRLNFEFDIECYDSALTAAIDALIDRKIARARRLSVAMLASAPRWARLRDAAARLLLPYL